MRTRSAFMLAQLALIFVSSVCRGQSAGQAQDSADTSGATAAVKKLQAKTQNPQTTGVACDPNWSSRFDLLPPQVQQRLRAELDQFIQSEGGAQSLLAGTQSWETEAFDERQLRQSQAQGQLLDWTSEQYGNYRRGMIEILRCRSSGAARTAAVGDPQPLDCTSLAKRRDTELIKQFDLALVNYSLYREEIGTQIDYAKATANLMNDHWWVRQSDVEIAIEVARVSDHIKAWLGPMVSKDKELNEAVSQTIKYADKTAGDAADKLTDIMLEVKVREGAKQMVDKAEKESVNEAISRRFGPLGDSIVAENEHLERVEGMEQFKSEVQNQVGMLLVAAKKASEKVKGSKAEMEFIDQIRQQIDQACGNPVVIHNPN